MTYKELLQACSNGSMPLVWHKDFGEGLVRVIKNGNHKGIGVKFDKLNYEIWFHATDGGDKRSKYMSELTLIL